MLYNVIYIIYIIHRCFKVGTIKCTNLKVVPCRPQTKAIDSSMAMAWHGELLRRLANSQTGSICWPPPNLGLADSLLWLRRCCLVSSGLVGRGSMNTYITLHYPTLHCIALDYTTLHYITLHYITLHCIALFFITLHCITLQYITLHYIHDLCIYIYTHYTHIFLYIYYSICIIIRVHIFWYCFLYFLFFSLGHLSLLFATFWNENLYFAEFWELKFAICTVHRFFHGFTQFFPWCSLIYPKFSSMFS